MLNKFYRSPRLLIVTICLILLWGFSSLQALSRMENPQSSQWWGTVVTEFPGASPERVESLVTQKIEKELQEVQEIKSITSTSRLGNSLLLIILKDTVKNHSEVWARVRDRLTDIAPELPPEATTPRYIEYEIRAHTLIVALTWQLNVPANYALLRRQMEELEQQLRSLGSVKDAELWGAPSEEILVEIKATDLASLNLTPQELSQQISFSDAKVSSGSLHSSQNRLLMEVDSELDSLERIRRIPLLTGKNPGNLTMLGDIAKVTKNTKEPPSELAMINRKPGVVLAVRIDSNKRLDQWMKKAHQTLEQFQDNLSQGIQLKVLLDENYYVKNRLNSLFKNLLLGILCIFISTAFLMGWKSALIIGFSLPLCLLMIFGEMNIFNIPLHQISLIGLIIALGILIDNAIVVVDDVQHRQKIGLSPQKAISQTVKYLAIPLFASTFTTILSFLPVALMIGDVGEFVRTIGFTVILALSSSYILSLTIIPALYGRLYLFFTGERNNYNFNVTQYIQLKFNGIYHQTLDYLLSNPSKGAVLVFILPIIGLILGTSLPPEFFPPADRNQIHIELELVKYSSLKKTQSVVEKASNIILNHSEVTDLHWFIGTHPPTFYYTVWRAGVKGGTSHYASAMVQIANADSSSQIVQTLQKELDQAYPSARILVRQLEQQLPVPPIELRIYGSNLYRLKELGNQARLQLMQVSNITHTRASLEEALPKLEFLPDEDQGRFINVNNTEIAQQLNNYLEGRIGGSIIEETEELPVRVRLSNYDRANLNLIKNIDIFPKTRIEPSRENFSSTPLSNIGKINLVPDTAVITRRNNQRVNVISGFIAPNIIPSTVLHEFKQRLASSNFKLPPGYSLEWGGELAERNRSINKLLSNVSIVILLMISTLVLSFNSFRCAMIIFLVAIGSVGLALTSLWVFNYTLGFMAILGTIGLIGVAINDSIVILAAIRANKQASQGDLGAIKEIIKGSTRHIIATTITTIASFIPLILDGGKFWPPLAVAIAGGVGGATLLALFFVPCIYLVSTKYKLPAFLTELPFL